MIAGNWLKLERHSSTVDASIRFRSHVLLWKVISTETTIRQAATLGSCCFAGDAGVEDAGVVEIEGDHDLHSRGGVLGFDPTGVVVVVAAAAPGRALEALAAGVAAPPPPPRVGVLCPACCDRWVACSASAVSASTTCGRADVPVIPRKGEWGMSTSLVSTEK